MSAAVTAVELGAARARVTVPAEPSGAGVLLYPTIMGVNSFIDGVAAELAAQGLTVVAWDPYRGEPRSDDLMTMVVRSKSVEDEDAIADLGRIADHMHDDLGVERLAGIGWCFGGRIGLLHGGLDQRLQVFCSYNPTMLSPIPFEVEGVGTTSKADMPGQTMDEFELARGLAGPVQVTRPEKDFTQAAEYEALVAALFTRSAPTFYEYYPGVDHGFSYIPGEANQRAQRYAWRSTLALLADLRDQA